MVADKDTRQGIAYSAFTTLFGVLLLAFAGYKPSTDRTTFDLRDANPAVVNTALSLIGLGLGARVLAPGTVGKLLPNSKVLSVLGASATELSKALACEQGTKNDDTGT